MINQFEKCAVQQQGQQYPYACGPAVDERCSGVCNQARTGDVCGPEFPVNGRTLRGLVQELADAVNTNNQLSVKIAGIIGIDIAPVPPVPDGDGLIADLSRAVPALVNSNMRLLQIIHQIG